MALRWKDMNGWWQARTSRGTYAIYGVTRHMRPAFALEHTSATQPAGTFHLQTLTTVKAAMVYAQGHEDQMTKHGDTKRRGGKLVAKKADGWYWRRGSGPKFPWMGPYQTQHVAMQVRERATGGAWGLGTREGCGSRAKSGACADCGDFHKGACHADRKRRWSKRKQQIRDRSRRTRVGSRHRDPKTGQFS